MSKCVKKKMKKGKQEVSGRKVEDAGGAGMEDGATTKARRSGWTDEIYI